MSAALGVLGVVLLAPAVGAAAHFAVLTVASLGYRDPTSEDASPLRFLVVVPAHDEEKVIGASLQSLRRALRSRDHLLVVADRCTDATATIARDHGAVVVERPVDSSPGRAAARQTGIEAARELAWDALVMIDADSTVDPGFFEACERALGAGATALQARSEATPARSVIGQASVAAFALQGVTMPRGRDRLGVMVRLRGTGMVLRREIAERYAFTAPASEDLFYSLELCLDGVVPRHVERARVRSLMAERWDVAAEQRVRYEAGRLSAARRFVGPLLRRRTRASLEAAWWLAVPPFATSVALLLAGGLLAVLAGWTWLALVAGLSVGVMVASLLTGLVQASAPPRTWLALAAAPAYVMWKVPVQLVAIVRSGRRVREFPATSRD